MNAPPSRPRGARHASGAALLVLLSVAVALGAGACNIFENIVGIAGVCSTTADCPAGELCEGCVGDETCLGTCVSIALRPRKFLDDALLDAGPTDEDAGVVDAGPPPGPAITQFRIIFSDHVTDGEPITVEYGTKPGISYDSRGMAWCQLFMPGEDLVGYEDYAPEPLVRATYGEVLGVDDGVLRDTTITLTCREALEDGGVGDEHVRSAPLEVRCDDPQPLPGDVVVNLSMGLRQPTATCRVVSGDVTLEQPLVDPGTVDAGVPGDGGDVAVIVPFDVALERMFADVVAINGSYIYRDVTGDPGLIGFSPPAGGLPIERISGGVALYNNADLEDVSVLDGVTIEGAGTVEIGVDVPFSLLVRRNDQLTRLTGVHLVESVPSDLVISDNAVLDPGVSVIDGSVGGAVRINNNEELTTLSVVSGLTSAGILEVTGNEMLSSVSLTALETLGTELLADQTTLDIDLNVVDSVVLSQVVRIDGQILVRNLQNSVLLDNFEVGGAGTTWNGDNINLSEASAVALAQACDLLFNRWTTTVPPENVTRGGQLFFVEAADCPP